MGVSVGGGVRISFYSFSLEGAGCLLLGCRAYAPWRVE